ncbi:MAG: hypothetical protein JSV94_03805, partial [Methanobacteriota archaeon]
MSARRDEKGKSVGIPFLDEVRIEKARLTAKRLLDVTTQILRNPMGAMGVGILVVFSILAAVGPAIAPYDTSNLGEGKWSLPSDFATDAPLSAEFTSLIMLPLVSIVASAVALRAAFLRTSEWRLNKILQVAALAASSVLACVLTFAYLSLVFSNEEFGLWGRMTTEWNNWLYPVSVVGACLVMLSYGTRRRVSRKRSVRRWFGIGCAAAPLAVMSLFLVVDFPPERSGHHLLTAYMISGFFLLISGMSFRGAYARPPGVVTKSEKRGLKFPTRIATLTRGTAILLASTVIITGISVYLVENWTTHWMGTDSFEAD